MSRNVPSLEITLVWAIERLARERGLTFLELESSVTAEPFYAALDYQVRERGEHALKSGQRMACVVMRKKLLGERLRLF